MHTDCLETPDVADLNEESFASTIESDTCESAYNSGEQEESRDEPTDNREAQESLTDFERQRMQAAWYINLYRRPKSEFHR